MAQSAEASAKYVGPEIASQPIDILHFGRRNPRKSKRIQPTRKGQTRRILPVARKSKPKVDPGRDPRGPPSRMGPKGERLRRTFRLPRRQARNVMLGLAKTCMKLKIPFFDYLGARLGIPGRAIPNLATFVRPAPS
jgi:hypothetical protein